MFTTKSARLLGVVLLVVAQSAWAQSEPADYRDEFLQHFERSSRKIIALAEAMPEKMYTWRPGEGVMSVAQVYAHIARYNFLYLETSLDMRAPAGIDVPNLETITDKREITALLRRSVAHVRDNVTVMTTDQLTESTRLYGRQVAGWAVLFQLLSHMNEHVGQSVAYARVNGVVPPWSS